ncbi:MAG: hypothetical protein ACREBN_02125 [Burkholderiaceae bacterium]
MTNEPKSLSHYLFIATLIVAPVMAFITTHVDTKVTPVSGYVAQVYGVQDGAARVALASEQTSHR